MASFFMKKNELSKFWGAMLLRAVVVSVVRARTVKKIGVLAIIILF